ncbi:MAG: ABC transporter permease [Candidatus Acidiferrales bacterium]
MGTLLQDIRYGLRMLARNPGFTIVAVLTLALGIGANTAIFGMVQSILLRALPYQDPENLVQVWNTYPTWGQLPLSPGDYRDFQQKSREFSGMAAYVDVPQGFNMTGQGNPERLQAAFASSELFPLLGIRPVAGRTFTPDENKPGSAPALMISHRLWKSHFGADPTVVGRTLTLDGRGYTLAGVLPGGFQLVPAADLWLPIGQYQDDLAGRIHHPFNVLARLKSGITITQGESELQTLNRQVELSFPDTHKGWGVIVRRMEDPAAVKLRLALVVLFAAVGLVLLIACANIVNLLLARNAARQKEIALRIALGADRLRLIRQLLTESVLLSLLGGTLGILLAGFGFQLLGAFVPPDLAGVKAVGLNGWVLGFTLAVCFITGTVCGLIPALQTLNQNLNDVLKEGGRTSAGSGGQKIRNVLVISEIALALVPLVGAGLLIRSFHRLLQEDPGFRPEHVLTMEVNLPAIPLEVFNKMSADQQTELAQKQSIQFEEIARRIERLPGVKAVGSANVLPLGSAIRSSSRFVVEGQPAAPAGARPVAEIRSASLRFFAAMGIPLLQGRLFTEADYGLSNIVINEAMARRFWPGGDAIGKRINVCSLNPQPCWSPIVGIVGNVHQYGLERVPTLDAYFTRGWNDYFVIRTTADPASLAHAAAEEVHKADPNLPVTHVTTLDSLLSESVSPRRFSAVLLGIFAALALVLAAVGIYGVMSYIVSLRTNEIGIRMALGAQPRDILSLIVGRGTRLAAAGIALGLAGALALSRLLSSLLYGVRATDPATFAGVALLLAAVALLACYLPARRAMRVDPMVALRYE